MANASTADARAGWFVFRADPEITLDLLNARIESAGRKPVSERMFGHYRHLMAHGYDRYISINRFDVARAARPYEGASTSPRYRYYATELGVTVVLTRHEGVFEVAGRAERVGEVGALLLFEGVEVVDGLRRSKLGADDYVELRFDDQNPPVAARIVSRDMDDMAALVEVEFTRLQPISEFIETSVVGVEPIRLRVQGSEPSDRAADLIGRRIYYVLEALESARAMANEVLGEGDPLLLEIVGAPQIRQLQLINPLVIELTATGVLGLIITSAWKMLKQGPTAYAHVMEAHGGHLTQVATAERIEAEARKIDAEAKRVELQNARVEEELTTQKVLHTIARRELRKLSNSEPSERFKVLEDVLWKNLEGLQRQDVRELEVQTGTDPDESSNRAA